MPQPQQKEKSSNISGILKKKDSALDISRQSRKPKKFRLNPNFEPIGTLGNGDIKYSLLKVLRYKATKKKSSTATFFRVKDNYELFVLYNHKTDKYYKLESYGRMAFLLKEICENAITRDDKKQVIINKEINQSNEKNHSNFFNLNTLGINTKENLIQYFMKQVLSIKTPEQKDWEPAIKLYLSVSTHSNHRVKTAHKHSRRTRREDNIQDKQNRFNTLINLSNKLGLLEIVKEHINNRFNKNDAEHGIINKVDRTIKLLRSMTIIPGLRSLFNINNTQLLNRKECEERKRNADMFLAGNKVHWLLEKTDTIKNILIKQGLINFTNLETNEKAVTISDMLDTELGLRSQNQSFQALLSENRFAEGEELNIECSIEYINMIYSKEFEENLFQNATNDSLLSKKNLEDIRNTMKGLVNEILKQYHLVDIDIKDIITNELITKIIISGLFNHINMQYIEEKQDFKELYKQLSISNENNIFQSDVAIELINRHVSKYILSKSIQTEQKETNENDNEKSIPPVMTYILPIENNNQNTEHLISIFIKISTEFLMMCGVQGNYTYKSKDGEESGIMDELCNTMLLSIERSTTEKGINFSKLIQNEDLIEFIFNNFMYSIEDSQAISFRVDEENVDYNKFKDTAQQLLIKALQRTNLLSSEESNSLMTVFSISASTLKDKVLNSAMHAITTTSNNQPNSASTSRVSFERKEIKNSGFGNSIDDDTTKLKSLYNQYVTKLNANNEIVNELKSLTETSIYHILGLINIRNGVEHPDRLLSANCEYIEKNALSKIIKVLFNNLSTTLSEISRILNNLDNLDKQSNENLYKVNLVLHRATASFDNIIKRATTICEQHEANTKEEENEPKRVIKRYW